MNWTRLLLAVATTTAFASTTSADLVRMSFDGTVTELHGELAGTWAGAQIGDTFEVVWTFDTDATDIFPPENAGVYDDAIQSFEVKVGTATETTESGSIVVIANPTAHGIVGNTQLANYVTPEIFLRSPRFLFDDDSIPTHLEIDSFENREFALKSPIEEDSFFMIVGEVESIESVILSTACAPDLDGDSIVAFADVLAVIGAWGACADCDEDLNGDGVVNFADVIAVLTAWGPCAGT